MLDELDQTQRLLEEEFPECKIGYAYRPGHVTWSAQIGPVLNAGSPDALSRDQGCLRGGAGEDKPPGPRRFVTVLAEHRLVPTDTSP
jgi:hypothetical protein